jgi:hypothetical protein
MCIHNKEANLKNLMNLLWFIYKYKFMRNYIKIRNLIYFKLIGYKYDIIIFR